MLDKNLTVDSNFRLELPQNGNENLFRDINDFLWFLNNKLAFHGPEDPIEDEDSDEDSEENLDEDSEDEDEDDDDEDDEFDDEMNLASTLTIKSTTFTLEKEDQVCINMPGAKIIIQII